jgi:hypothetical protein
VLTLVLKSLLEWKTRQQLRAAQMTAKETV